MTNRELLILGFIFLHADLTDDKLGIVKWTGKKYKSKYKELHLEEVEEIEILNKLHKQIKHEESATLLKRIQPVLDSLNKVAVQRNLLAILLLERYYKNNKIIGNKSKLMQCERISCHIKEEIVRAHKDTDINGRVLSRTTHRCVVAIDEFLKNNILLDIEQDGLHWFR